MNPALSKRDIMKAVSRDDDRKHSFEWKDNQPVIAIRVMAAVSGVRMQLPEEL
jgi:hypothetical protein